MENNEVTCHNYQNALKIFARILIMFFFQSEQKFLGSLGRNLAQIWDIPLFPQIYTTSFENILSEYTGEQNEEDQ